MHIVGRFGVRHIIPALVLLVARPRVAHACSCARPTSARRAAELSAAVFTGRVVEIRTVPGRFGPDLRVTFAVARAWKGSTATRAVVLTAASTSACGYPFVVGRTYLVFAAHEANGQLETGHCSRTAMLSHALKDATELGPGRVIEPDPMAPGPPLHVVAPPT